MQVFINRTDPSKNHSLEHDFGGNPEIGDFFSHTLMILHANTHEVSANLKPNILMASTTQKDLAGKFQHTNDAFAKHSKCIQRNRCKSASQRKNFGKNHNCI